MRSSEKLWGAWKLAKAYRCRPSEVFHIDDPLAAYCFDRAVAAFGLTVEDAIEKATEGKKANQIEAAAKMALNTWVGHENNVRPKQKFREPVATRR